MRRIFNLETLFAVSLFAGVVFSTTASAAWVEKSDAWCKKRGFTPPCEVWEKARLEKGSAGDPRVGAIRASTIFDRWGRRITPAPAGPAAPARSSGPATPG